MAAAPSGPYQVILADCPWTFRTYSPKGEGRSASRHYPTMTLDAIKALPVASLAARDSVLLLWTTDPFLEKAFEVIRAWGYRYSTVGFYWVKTNALDIHGRRRDPTDGTAGLIYGDRDFHMGTGYHTRANPEQCLLAVRGKGLPRLSRSVRKLVVAPVQGHSRKPFKVRDRIRLLYPGPYLELFARERSPGWFAWGDEVSPAPCRLEAAFIVPPPADPGAGDRTPAGGAGSALCGGDQGDER